MLPIFLRLLLSRQAGVRVRLLQLRTVDRLAAILLLCSALSLFHVGDLKLLNHGEGDAFRPMAIACIKESCYCCLQFEIEQLYASHSFFFLVV